MKKINLYLLILIIITILFILLNIFLEKKETFENSSKNPNNYQLRQQWDENNGYCGETCLITIGLKYGQYFSQYDMRTFSYQVTDESNSPKLKKDPKCDSKNSMCKVQGDKNYQALIETNLADLAKKVHLYSESWSSTGNKKINQQKTTIEFYEWIYKIFNKPNKYHVIIGVYETVNCFSNFNLGNGYNGQDDYDHIVLVSNITKDNKNYNLFVNDVGNRQTATLPHFEYDAKSKKESKYFKLDYYESLKFEDKNYIFNIPSGTGIKNRKESNTKDNSNLCYTIPDNSKKDFSKIPYGNVGIAIKGLLDKPPNEAIGKLLNINITPSIKYEFPLPNNVTDDNKKLLKSNTRPNSFDLKLTVDISGLTKNKKYKILKFNDIDKVTNKDNIIVVNNSSNNFNITNNEINGALIFTSNSTSYKFVDNIKSSDQVIYRGYEIR